MRRRAQAGPILFVYGSLMRGQPAHGLVAAAPFLGPARTAPCFHLVDLGPYPGLVDGGTMAVEGELYAIPPRLLPHIDAFEGHPRHYRRRPIPLAGGRHAHAYVLTRRPTHACIVPVPHWPTWLRRRRRDGDGRDPAARG